MGSEVVAHRVHRLVGKAFLDNPEGKPQINHKNGVRSDNRVENLEWVTNLENALHASEHRFLVHGSAHANTTLTEDDVRNIRSQYRNGTTLQELCNTHNLSLGTMSHLVRGKTWKHVDGAVPKKTAPRAKLMIEQVRKIRLEYKHGAKQVDLAKKYGIGRPTMSMIVNDKIWQEQAEVGHG